MQDPDPVSPSAAAPVVIARTVNHLNIVVADMQRSLDFYVGLLGMRVTFDTDLHGDWIDAVAGIPGVSAHCVFIQPQSGGAAGGIGARFELLQYRMPPGVDPAENRLANTRGLRHFALEVDDLDEAYSRLVARGVSFLSPPVTVPFRLMDGVQKRLCYCHDPDGVIVELCEFRFTDSTGGSGSGDGR